MGACGSSSKKEKPSSVFSSPIYGKLFSSTPTTDNLNNNVSTHYGTTSINNLNTTKIQTSQPASNTTLRPPDWNSEDEKLRLRLNQQLSITDNAVSRRQITPTTDNLNNNVSTQYDSTSTNNLNATKTPQPASDTTLHPPNWNSEDKIKKLGLRLNQQPSITHNAVSRRQIEAPERSKINHQLFDISNNDSVITYTHLSQHDLEYIQINKMITNKRNFKVDSIIKITNPYLETAYELKKEQKQQQYPYLEEHLLFHGTKHAIVDNIIKENFDWRYCKSHLFGKGVSFSPNATYASNYSDKNIHNKVMIVAKVLIGESCMGNSSMILPDEGCDTSQKDSGIVIVKYEDNEFYPAYKILYHLVDENIGRANRNRKPVRRQQPIFFNYDSDGDYNDFYNN